MACQSVKRRNFSKTRSLLIFNQLGSRAYESTLRVTYMTIASTIKSAISAHEQCVILLPQSDVDKQVNAS